MQIKTYNGASAEPKKGETVFYIQSHGFNAGRPLKKPLPNCWEVRTERSADFEILYIVFESKILAPFFRGSVIPFIALHEYKNIIFPILKNAIHENKIINEHYLQIRKIETQLQQQDKIKNLMQELKKSISRELYNKIKSTA
ncbi:DUF6943 family protein [Chryseobacterium sp. MP_3.2]|uniref:DUF6943 family protein n=1 Tax=Chryseobacterium sp. MP_3.2 TaxID=3071712 RepID=UPI002E08207B|nr:hypothetical protein [Chryseobacterium sp. MP_3.2]